MSQLIRSDVAVGTESKVSSSPKRMLSHWPESFKSQVAVLAAMIFAIAPLWIPYSARMWTSGHYQYFPVLLAVVGYLLYGKREQLQNAATPPSTWLVASGFLATAFLALAGHLLNSGFFGIVAAIVACWTLIYAWYGAGGLRQSWTVLLLLLFIVPLPLSLDQSLVVKMQFWASQLAAQFLDGLGIMHFRQGVILVTEKSQFLTEEACSGIRSLFSSLAFVAAMSVMQHHHWARALFNLLQTVAWVILGNAIRVAAVVILADHVSTWFATGAGHELLGMAVFLFILTLVASTDAFVGMLVMRPLGIDHEAVVSVHVSSSLTTATDGEVKGALGTVGAMNAFAFRWSPQVKFGWITLFGIIGLLGCWVYIVHTGVLEQGGSAIVMPELPPPAENDLPTLLGDGWQRVNFDHIERDINPILARESYVYTYGRNGQGLVISVDWPWAEWHNLDVCYHALGWESKPNYFVSRPQAGESATQSELQLSKPDKSAFVIFAVVDRQRKELSPSWRTASGGLKGIIDGLVQQAAASLGLSRQTQYALTGRQLPATTIQLMTESSEPLTERDYEEYRAIYDVVRKRLLAGQRWR